MTLLAEPWADLRVPRRTRPDLPPTTAETPPLEDCRARSVPTAAESHSQAHRAWISASDERLMEAFRAGDPGAFEVLARRHSRALYNYLLRSVHNPARAEEMLQDTLLRVVRSKDRYRRSAKFTTWMYTIARNLCVDESRRARFRDHESLEARRFPGDAEEGRTLLSGLAAEEVPTDAAAEAPRLRHRLAQAVERLPDDQREVFLMRQLAGMSFREIGDTVGAPENTVKSRMRYALEKLRQELADLHVDAAGAPASATGIGGQRHG